jgi:phosphoribosyl 1,2-cyclic phosphate phosphodiesterase
MIPIVLKILGCGTSTGVPLIQCKCFVCSSKNSKNKRLRTSAWLRINGKSFLIDTSPDLRQQALRTDLAHIDAVFYTHPHADHIQGIDELRSFNYLQKARIPVFGNDWTCKELKIKFAYIFNPGVVEGGGIPQLDLNLIQAQDPSFEVLGEKIIPLSLSHGSKECVGYRFGPLAYVTDCNYISPSTMERMQGLKVLVLDCLQLGPHRTHMNLEQALTIISALKPKKTYLTHLGHEFDYTLWSKKLPKDVRLAYDGLTINVHP